MRLRVGTLQRVVKRDLPIAFVPQQLTSYGGLELLRRYLRRLALPQRLQVHACARWGRRRRAPGLAADPGRTLTRIGAAMSSASRRTLRAQEGAREHVMAMVRSLQRMTHMMLAEPSLLCD
jgi:hypothetical protein